MSRYECDKNLSENWPYMCVSITVSSFIIMWVALKYLSNIHGINKTRQTENIKTTLMRAHAHARTHTNARSRVSRNCGSHIKRVCRRGRMLAWFYIYRTGGWMDRFAGEGICFHLHTHVTNLLIIQIIKWWGEHSRMDPVRMTFSSRTMLYDERSVQ